MIAQSSNKTLQVYFPVDRSKSFFSKDYWTTKKIVFLVLIANFIGAGAVSALLIAKWLL